MLRKNRTKGVYEEEDGEHVRERCVGGAWKDCPLEPKGRLLIFQGEFILKTCCLRLSEYRKERMEMAFVVSLWWL